MAYGIVQPRVFMASDFASLFQINADCLSCSVTRPGYLAISLVQVLMFGRADDSQITVRAPQLHLGPP